MQYTHRSQANSMAKEHHLQDLIQMPLPFQQSLSLFGSLRPVGQPLDFQSRRASGKNEQRDHVWGNLTFLIKPFQHDETGMCPAATAASGCSVCRG